MEDLAEKCGVDAQPGGKDLHAGVGFQQGEKDQKSRDKLGDHGGVGHALHTQPKPENKEQVQDDVGEGAYHKIPEGSA